MTEVEAIALVEQLLKRGRLNTVQEIVFSESWAGQTYLDIAINAGYDPGYIKDVGSKLWRSISEIVGEKVTKNNLRGVLQRAATFSFPPVTNYTNWGEAIPHSGGYANDVTQFYGRTEELVTLNRWILGDRCRVVAILGIGGIGKTALSVKLAKQLQGEFEYVIWRSIRNAPALPDLLADIVVVLSRQQEIEISPTAHISRLIYYLQQHRCLLILDNVESILLSGHPHQYLAGYEAYGELFRQLAECSHQSCVLLTSREQIAEVAMFAGEHLPIRILPLRGLSIDESMLILEDKGLPLTIDNGQQLVDLYAGNPLALKIISTSILELFDGRIAEFFDCRAAVFNGIRVLLERQFARLSPVESQIMYWLAIEREWVSIEELQADIIPAISIPQLLESLEYLQGRSLIEHKRGKFTQQAVVMEYTIDRLLTAVRTEICDREPKLLLRYALMKATAKDYVRESQIRIVVQPLLTMLQADLGGKQAIDRTLKQILQQLSTDSFSASSYGAGNCLNLLFHLQSDVTGLDLSGLTIRQADLRDLPLHRVNFTDANLATSVFAESIGDIHKVIISPDDRLVANSCSDGRISLWDTSNGQNVLNIKAHHSYVVGMVFTADSRRLISGSFDKYIKIRDVDSGECLESWQSSAAIYGIALSGDGKILACNGEHGSILLWDVATHKLLKSLTGHTAQVRDLAFHPDSTLLVSGSFDATIKLWDLTTCECVATLTGHTQVIWSVAFNALGTQLLSSSFDTSIKLWDVQTGACLQTMQAHSHPVGEAIFTSNGQLIVSCSQDSTVRMWATVPTGEWQCIRVLQGHKNMWSLAVNATGNKLISGDNEGILKFWDVESGECLKTLSSIPKAFRTLAFNSDGNLLASSGDDRKIRLWDINIARCTSTISAHAMAVWHVAFPPQGDLLASCSMDSTVKLWNISDNAYLQVHPPPLQQDCSFAVAIAFAPDAEILAVGSGDAMIRLWNYRTRELLQAFQTLEGNILVDLDFHPQGQLLASASHDSDLRIWDVKTGTCHQTLPGHTSHIWSVAFHPQGKLLASGSEDSNIRIWNVQTGECLQVLNEHTSTITAVKFSPDGAYLASSSNDLTVRLWDVNTWTCIRVLTGHTSLVTCLAYHPDPQRRLLASCSHDDTIRLWDTDTGECIDVLQPQRIYEGMNVSGATGITTAQLATLKGLGAMQDSRLLQLDFSH